MRIVSLLSSATEILFALGLGDQVLATSHECDYPPAAAKLPRATRSLIDSSQPSHKIDKQVKRLTESGAALYDIDRDLIRDLRPDLIITQAQCDVCAVRYQDVIEFVEAESALAATRVVALNPHSLAEILGDISTAGRAAQASAATVAAYTDSLLQRILRVHIGSSSSQELKRPRVAVIEWTDPLMAAGNWTPELVESAGGKALGAVAGQPSNYWQWPDIISAKPDVLIIAPCGFDLERSLIEGQKLVDLAGYHQLPAVRMERSFVIDGNAYLNRSGPRIVGSLEILAHLIRPDLFEPPSGELAEGRAWARMPKQ